MKKIFTFLIAMAFVFVAFAQNEGMQSIRLDQPNVNTAKSNWYGNTNSNTWSSGSFTEGTVIARRFAANELPVGGQIEKVTFYGFVSNGGENFNTNFTIRVYSGGTGAWLDTNTYTGDANVCGSVIAQQSYTMTANGDQFVTLTNPVTIPAGQEIWIAIECLGNSGLAFQVDQDSQDGEYSTTSIWYRYYSDDEAYFWVAPRWCADSECETTQKGEWHLACYVNDGQAYVAQSDMKAYMFDPFVSTDEWPTITEQVITEDYEYDSLYICMGVFNNGVDEAQTNLLSFNLYYEGLDDGTIYAWDYSDASDTLRLALNRGWIWGNVADDGIEGGFPIVAITDLADYGLSYPFDVCFSVGYDGTDPDLTNNNVCVTFRYQGVGIQENAAQTLSVYPNPAKNVITVSNVAGAQISIYNLAGQQVANVNAASANQTINVANLSEGLYVIRVANGNQVSTSKFSVVR